MTIALIISTKIKDSISRAMIMVEQVASGNLTHKVQNKGKDEIGIMCED